MLSPFAQLDTLCPQYSLVLLTYEFQMSLWLESKLQVFISANELFIQLLTKASHLLFPLPECGAQNKARELPSVA